MFLVDDLLLLPGAALMGLMREIRDQARQAQEGETGSIRDRLSTLYMELETGRITREDFDRREEELVAMLEEAESASDSGELE